MEETVNRHPILKEIFQSYEMIFSDPPVDKDFDDAGGYAEAVEEEERLFDADNFCKTTVMLCLPNLKEIFERSGGYMDGSTLDLHLLCDVLLRIIYADSGRTALQQLEILVLESGSTYDLLDMCAFTILPKLKSLKVVGVWPRGWSSTPLKGGDTEMHSNICHAKKSRISIG
jgi:hypothetical protein